MLIPSIDLMNGKAVQLREGKTVKLISKQDPIELAKEFSRYGIPAVIDLDAAMNRGNNRELVKEICRRTGARAGGGIRTRETASELLRAGASKIILGTALWDTFVTELPIERIQAAIDTNNGQVMVNGWKAPSNMIFKEQMEKVSERASSLLCTFIEDEGSMNGLTVNRVTELKKLTNIPLTVAGGVKDTQNAVSLMQCGVDVQVGMSLYTGELKPALAVASILPENALTPTVVENSYGQVLMLAWSNRESLREALKTGRGVYFSRSRNELWRKGATSGNVQKLIRCRFDCDKDTILFTVDQTGAACHTNSYSCFGSRVFNSETLQRIISSPEKRENSYTAKLQADPALLSRKVLEESAEVVFAKDKNETIWEVADLIYFLTVLLEEKKCTWEDVWKELEGRWLI